MMHLTVAYEEPTGYKYVETSDELEAAAAAALPCFKALHWPNSVPELAKLSRRRRRGGRNL
jgi:hypothetical protein